MTTFFGHCRVLAGFIWVPIAVLVVLAQDRIWPAVRGIGLRAAAWPPLASLRRRVAALPPVAALPLFLVPEVFSRCGTLVSAWLLIQGDGWRALAAYVASKLVAGGAALWIYTACEAALLRIPAYAAIHGGLAALRRATLAWLQGRVPGSAPLAAALDGVRARRALPTSIAPHP